MAIKKTKIEDAELQELKEFQTQIDSLQISLGQIQLQRLNLDNEESLLKQKYQILITKEKEIGEQLTNKYGQVQIDLKTGEFINSENKS